MSPLNLEQVEEIFQTAIDLPPEQRAVYLGKVCASSGEMRAEVDALILAYEESADFIERPAMEIDAAVVARLAGWSAHRSNNQPLPNHRAAGRRRDG